MNQTFQSIFQGTSARVINYLPNLGAGAFLIVIGWVLGWFTKRIFVRVCFAFRLDRLLRKFPWGSGFSRADLQFALYESLGNLGFLIVFLIFVNAALEVLQLTVLSNLLAKGVLFLPKILTAGLILALGWLTASSISTSIYKILAREDIPRSMLIARFLKSVMLLFVMAMALTELDIAREIVIIGFATAIVTLGALTITLTVLGGKNVVEKIVNSIE